MLIAETAFATMSFQRPLFSRPSQICYQCRRLLHSVPQKPKVPETIPFVPDVPTFLTVIGRGLNQHASKFPSWNALFSYSSQELRDLGIEPARNRRYLLHWRHKFRNKEFGIGGDLKHVKDGVAELRLLEVPSTSPSPYAKAGTGTKAPGTIKIVANVPNGSDKPDVPLTKVKPVKNVKVRGARTICGPWVQSVKGTSGLGARLAVQEGIWEHRRGHKVDGGERRKAEVRAKRRAQERRDQEA